MLLVTSFSATLKLNIFYGTNFKRWQNKMILWLTAMHVIHVIRGKPDQVSPKEEKSFKAADNLFPGAMISILADHLFFYLSIAISKELWDALEANFGVTNAGSELYVMEKLSDYKMVDDRLVVEHTLAKELVSFKCELSHKFAAGSIIFKLPPSWMDFSTSK
jgi:hypothetical protein